MDKDRLEYIKQIKSEKNILAKKIATMNTYDYRHQANMLFGWYLIKGIYDKNFNNIREDLGVKKDFDIVSYMGVEHLRNILTALNKYNAIVEYKKGIPFARAKLSLQNNATEVGFNIRTTLKRSVEERTGRKTSIYTDLLKGIKDNVLLEDEVNYNLKQEQLRKDEEAFRRESLSYYTDEGIEDYASDNPEEFGFGPSKR